MNPETLQPYNPITLSLPTYLTVQLQQILECGDAHTLTYAPKDDWSQWLQISVHGGPQWYFMVQFPLPTHLSSQQFDRLFRAFGWSHAQMDGRETRVYFLGRCASSSQLNNQTESIACQLARAIEILWDIHTVSNIVLLGARGPQLALVRQSQPSQKPLALPRAA
jgi:hypothetical protein